MTYNENLIKIYVIEERLPYLACNSKDLKDLEYEYEAKIRINTIDQAYYETIYFKLDREIF